MTPTHDPGLSEAVRLRVDQRLQQLPLGEETTSDEDSASEEEQQTTRGHRPLKLGMNCMGATLVIKRITWPHEVVYSLAGKLVAYENLSVSAFLQGYLIVMH